MIYSRFASGILGACAEFISSLATKPFFCCIAGANFFLLPGLPFFAGSAETLLVALLRAPFESLQLDIEARGCCRRGPGRVSVGRVRIFVLRNLLLIFDTMRRYGGVKTSRVGVPVVLFCIRLGWTWVFGRAWLVANSRGWARDGLMLAECFGYL